MPKAKKKNKYDDEYILTTRSLGFLFCMLVVCLFLWPAMLTFHVGDWPSTDQYPNNDPIANACGVVGAWCAYHFRYFIGDGTYPLLFFVTVAVVQSMFRGVISQIVERSFGLALLMVCTAASSHLIAGSGQGTLVVGDGGLIGYAVGEFLWASMDRLGTLVVIAASFFVGLLFTTEGWVLKLPSTVGHLAQVTGSTSLLGRMFRKVLLQPQIATAGQGVSRGESDELLDEKRSWLGIFPRSNKTAVEKDPIEGDEYEYYDEEEDDDEEYEYVDVCEDEEGEKEKDEPRKIKAKSASRKKIAHVPIVNFPTKQKVTRAQAYPRQIENWTLPSLSLLNDPEYGFTAEQESLVREQARILEQTLEEFRLDARVVEIDTGPVITMFELKIGAGIKVSQIASLSNDIARALKAHAIRVVAPISGKNTVGIEVPNLRKETVRLKELMTLAGKKASEMALPLFLGKDAGGAVLLSDLTKMPHMLIAGTTGSGKSVCLNAVILSLLMTKRPDHVKMILIDPKMVEMSQFKSVPHLMCPIVTDMHRAQKILEWAVTKMEERYELLAEARVKHITSYNKLSKEELYDRFEPQNEQEKASIALHLPYIVIVIDELADLMMTAGKEVEHFLSRLAQKSRAVGIHIIVATQRPEAKVVTGLIKSNLPSRICFRVSSRMDSRIVLDQNGGEVLLGQGDMLFLPPGVHKLVRAQGTYLDDREVHAVLDDLAQRAQPEFHPELMRIKAPNTEDGALLRDPMFDKAVRVVLQSKRGSVSLLQRRLTIGYSRASRLIEQMAEAGIVGDYKGSQARETNMTLEEWDAHQAQVTQEIEEDNYAADAENEYDTDDDANAAAEYETEDEDDGYVEDATTGNDTDPY